MVAFPRFCSGAMYSGVPMMTRVSCPEWPAFIGRASPKSAKFHAAFLGDEDVGGLDVAVDDSAGVGELERVANLALMISNASAGLSPGPWIIWNKSVPSTNSITK